MATDQPDAVLVRWARAEDRVLLTRDRKLAAHQGVRALLVCSDNLDQQLIQVAHDLPLPAPRPGSRCPQDNQPLETIDADQAAGAIPPYVRRGHSSLKRCGRCGQIYWRGSHWQDLANKAKLLAGPLR